MVNRYIRPARGCLFYKRMTREEFVKYAYRHSEIIIFHQHHPDVDVECMLLAVDFDCGTFKLIPIDTDFYEDEAFYVSYECCSKPRSTKIIVDGKPRILCRNINWGNPKLKR